MDEDRYDFDLTPNHATNPPTTAPKQETPVVSTTQLSTSQWRALKALLDGLTQLEAAKQAGVSPRSITRWVNENPLFRQELIQGRAEMVQAARTKLFNHVNAAANTVGKRIREGDATLAMRLLDKLGASDRQEPPTPAEVVTSAESARQSTDDLAAFDEIMRSIVEQNS